MAALSDSAGSSGNPAKTIITPASSRLVDKFGRHITYLRISVTDRCDFRCVYCMDPAMNFVHRNNMLTLEEIAAIARTATELGITKLRITGGEPLVRRNVIWLLRVLGALPNVQELVLTTNGSQLARWAPALKAAGVGRINVSLDSLRPDRFRSITRFGDLSRVLEGINAARQVGFTRTKINTVVMKNRNHDEIVDLVRFAVAGDMDISFIEEMPIGSIQDHPRDETYYPSDQVLRDVRAQFSLAPTTDTTGGPARYYHIAGTNSRLGLISPYSHAFCGSCNRIRLTAEGRLLLCLGHEHSVDLRAVVRREPRSDEAIANTLLNAMAIKPKEHEFDLSAPPVIVRHMNTTGG